jgi:ppGpp synthetase/RelA/SpoT-type nucleotidyltranferase/8-oxo-dGTP pyrophosphatase MutT (NUDIX family)
MNDPLATNSDVSVKRGLSPRAVIRRRSDGLVLLLKRPPDSRHFPSRWEFPGGKPDPGENFIETLVRETREETGLEIVPGAVLGVAEDWVGDKRITFLFVEATSGDSAVQVCAGEHAQHRWMDLGTLAQLSATPEPDESVGIPDADPEAGRLVPAFRTFALEFARRHGYSTAPGPVPATVAAAGESDPMDRWVESYKARRPDFEALGELVTRLMKSHLKPLSPMAVIEGRTKGVASFAGKILRKRYADPLVEMTDLFGLRIITQIDAEVRAVCRFIRQARIAPEGRIHSDGASSDGTRPLFVVDEKNSEDKLERLRKSEFGYRSVHFVARLDSRAIPPSQDAETLSGLKFEIQVRTQLQHAWADIGHDRLYKGAFTVPDRFQREASRLAARLEDADAAFSRLVEGLEEYECHFGAYLDTAGIESRIRLQEAILRHDPGNPEETLRLARLHLALETADAAREAEAVACRIPEILRGADLWCALGDALRQQGGLPASAEVATARKAYARALDLEPGHRGAMTGLARTAPRPEDRLDAWAAACRANPCDTAILSGYVRQKIELDRDASFLPLLRPALLEAIECCRLQVEVKVDLPWALYRMAGFQLLLGEDGFWQACNSLAKAIRHDAKPRTIILEALDAVEKLLAADKAWFGAECFRRMLLCAIRVKHPDDPAAAPIESLATEGGSRLEGPVVIVAGGCDPAHEDRMAAYQTLLEEAFRGFQGTILSGGTEQGIAGLIGGLAARAKAGNPAYRGIRAVGYLPSRLPSDGTATRDLRYHERRPTRDTHDFSVLEPLQNWIDLLDSGVSPEKVRVLGINGGRIAGFEYLLAWALGAKVALLRDSGRVADAFEAGIRNGEYPGMLILPNDAMSAQAFLQGNECPVRELTEEVRERLARYAHALFLEEGRHRHPDDAMQPWDTLRADFKNSNLNQVDQMVRHLVSHGYRLVPLGSGESPYRFGPEDEAAVEAMARAEHGRWNVERLGQGWRYGPVRNTPERIHDCLVPWEELGERARSWDRNAVMRYPDLLAEVGLGIVPPVR